MLAGACRDSRKARMLTRGQERWYSWTMGDQAGAAVDPLLGTGDRRQWFPWGVGNPTFYLTLLVLAAAVGVAFVATQGSAAVAVAAGIASFMVGGTFGFLFGIPRYAASGVEREMQSAQAGVVKYRANTNLEQI